jgi:hypothetical protein
MPIVLIIEDGTSKPDSNSYVSVADARIYASNRGTIFTGTDDEVAAMLIQAMDYLEAQACRYQGSKTLPTQALQWPRTGVYLDCQPWPSDAIPPQLIAAQVQLAMAVQAGYSLLPNYSAADFVIREKVGPIETEYANPLSVGITPTFGAVDALLAPLFGECATNKFSIRTIRV